MSWLSDARGWNAPGTVELESGHANNALAAFERATAIDPRLPEFQNGPGIALTQEGTPVRAEPEFREAIRLMPDYGIAHLNPGQLLMSREDFIQSEWEFPAAELRPDPGRAELDPGMLLAKNGNRMDAAQHLNVATASSETAIRDLARQAMQKLNSGSR